MTTSTKETLGFQTEVKQLLDLVIHSLYSNKEIFLRELISNASDACDKLRFKAIENPKLYEADSELKIKVDFDPEARTITISDNGIGMSKEDAISHLGTIAKSGTREFFNSLSKTEKSSRSQLIGQFGVGFYSAFVVADQVTVVSRKAGLPASKAVRWISDGSGSFSVELVEKASRGTDVILKLRVDSSSEGESDSEPSISDWMTSGVADLRFSDFLDSSKLKWIIKRYSDHISLPILMPKEEWDEADKVSKKTEVWEPVNQASALWTRPKSEISEEHYKDFFNNFSLETKDPLIWTHNKVEGRIEYTQLLCIPSSAPFDLWDPNKQGGIRLYVQRVFIMDNVAQLLPPWLRFVRGIIDSNDLPLNVSRELIQQSRDIRSIRESNVKRVLGMLEELATKQPDKYLSFWANFGQVLKEGSADGSSDRILPLLRFISSESIKTKSFSPVPLNQNTQDLTAIPASYWVSLSDYVGRMKSGQEKIYYLTAPTLDAARNSPHLEAFMKRGIEVLLLIDRVDEWLVSFIPKFQEYQLISVARGDLKLSELNVGAENNSAQKDASVSDEVPEEQQKKLDPLLNKMKEYLSDLVKDVRITLRLTDSAACLVSDEGEMSANLERLLKQMGQSIPQRKPILEINPNHSLVAGLSADSQDLEDWSHVLFSEALLTEGGQLTDPATFVRRLNKLLASADDSASLSARSKPNVTGGTPKPFRPSAFPSAVKKP